jgi:hypothetical protein
MNSRWSVVGVLLILVCGAPDSAAYFMAGADETLEVSAGLGETIDQLAQRGSGPLWVFWSVPMIPGHHRVCCNNGRQGGRDGQCRLESSARSYSHDSVADSEEATDLQVLLRIDGGWVDEVRAYTSDCRLDAGELPVIRLDGVAPTASVDYLSSRVQARGGAEDRSLAALTAVAYHADPAADLALSNWSRPPNDAALRKQVAFWLGAARGKEGLGNLRRMLRDDPTEEVREQAVFGLSLIEDPEALNVLIDLARRDKQAGLRKTAVFWLSQKAGERAVEAIQHVVEEDPDAEVREQAVFAISQLPNGEGVPKLIELARSNRHREVREQAIFWLGQSGDPRALDLFEQILLGG